MFDFEDDGVGLMDEHAVPSSGFEVDERICRSEMMSFFDWAISVEDQDFEMARKEAD
ncbi:MAG: hypothetical protein ACJAVK_000720 [Akkermansiaceae bacterium]